MVKWLNKDLSPTLNERKRFKGRAESLGNWEASDTCNKE